jgi:predicted RNA-binding Zn-ribbon protein involved in translation (DUF1610 family)
VDGRAMSIESRLRRLEERRSAGRCPECGFTRDAPRPMAVIYEEDPERSFRGDPYEVCASCGQPLYCVIRVVRDSSLVEEGGGGRF